MRLMAMMAGLVGVLMVAGCAHVKGVAVDEISGKPLRTAAFTVGRPDGIAVYERHGVDANGVFDFYLSPTDANFLYVYDSAGAPAMTMERVDSQQISESMKLRVRPVSAAGRDIGGGSGLGIPAGIPQ